MMVCETFGAEIDLSRFGGTGSSPPESSVSRCWRRRAARSEAVGGGNGNVPGSRLIPSMSRWWWWYGYMPLPASILKEFKVLVKMSSQGRMNKLIGDLLQEKKIAFWPFKEYFGLIWGGWIIMGSDWLRQDFKANYYRPNPKMKDERSSKSWKKH